MDLVLLPFL